MSQYTQTERQDDFYNEMARYQVINESDFESEIVDYSCRVYYGFDYTVRYITGEKTSRYVWGKIPKNTLEELRNTDSGKRLGTELNEYVDICSADSKTKGDVIFVFKSRVVVKLPDATKITLQFKEKITGISPTNLPFYRAFETGHFVDVTCKDEGFVLTDRNGNSTDAKEVSELYETESEDEDLMQYVLNGKVWVPATISPLKDDGETACFEVNSDSVSVTFKFENPKSKNSRLWEVAEYFNVDDPILLDGVEVELCFSPFAAREGEFTEPMWSIDRDSNRRSTIEKAVDTLLLR